MTTTSIDEKKTTNSAEAILNEQVDGQDEGNALPTQGRPESELRAAARRHGLTLKELAAQMGVNKGHLCSVANGHRPWTPYLREKVMAVLGEVPRPGHRLPAGRHGNQ